MKKYSEIKKRLLALTLAGVFAFTTMLGSVSVRAEEINEEEVVAPQSLDDELVVPAADEPEEVVAVDDELVGATDYDAATPAGFTECYPDCYSILQLRKAVSEYEKPRQGTFAVSLADNTTLSYTVNYYANCTSSNPQGTLVYTSPAKYFVANQGDGNYVVTFTNDDNGTTTVFAQDEYYSTEVVFNTSNAEVYGKSSAYDGYYKYSKISSAQPMGCDAIVMTYDAVSTPTDVNTITLNKEKAFLKNGESTTLSATLNPERKRIITYSSTNTSVASVSASGVVVASNSGKTTISAAAGGKTATCDIYVMAATLSPASSKYSGSAIEPAVTVTCGTILEKDTHYTLDYTNNVNCGEGSVTITGIGDYAGYSEKLTFEIQKKDLAKADFDGATWKINTHTNTVTSVSGINLTLGTDFTANAYRTAVTATSITYTISVKAPTSSNYKGTINLANIKVTAAADSKLDISDLISEVQWDDTNGEFTFSDSSIEPIDHVTFLDNNKKPITGLASYCTVTYQNNKNVPSDSTKTPKIVLKGKADNNLTGEYTVEFQILPADLTELESDSSLTVEFEGGSSVFESTGNPLKPKMIVTRDGSTILEEGTDYELSYDNNTKIAKSTATKAPIVYIHGIGNYTGDLSMKFTIQGTFEKDLVLTIGGKKTLAPYESAYNKDYNGKAYEPTVVATLGGETLQKGETKDYTLVYKDNVKAGKAKIVITGHGKYEGQEVEATFIINAIDVSTSAMMNMENLPTYIYDGTAKTIDAGDMPITVSDSTGQTVTLVSGTDYDLTFDNNIGAGDSAKVTATFKGNYKGSIEENFTIQKLDLSESNTAVTVSNLGSYAYTGQAISPTFTVSYNGKVIPASNYTPDPTNNVNCGTAKLNITGKANCTGSRDVYFTIDQKSISDTVCTVNGYKERTEGTKQVVSYTGVYTGKAVSIPETLVRLVDKDTNEQLKFGDDYTFSCTNNVKAGQYTAVITITGGKNYLGTKTIYYSIDKRDIGADTIEITNEGTTFDDGEYVLPNLTIRDSDTNVLKSKRNLVMGVDYKLEPADEKCKTAGTGRTVKIIGIGNYEGENSTTYTIGQNLANATLGLQNPYTGDQYALTAQGFFQVTYLGNDITPQASLTDLSSHLIPSTCYQQTTASLNQTNKYDSFGNQNKVRMRIDAVANKDYYGTTTIDYIIVNAQFNTSQIKIRDIGTNEVGTEFEYEYDVENKEKTLSVEVKYDPSEGTVGGKEITLKEGTDYTIDTKKFGPAVGSYTVKVTGKGNYVDTTDLTYKIVPLDLSDVTRFEVTGLGNQYYTGNAIVPPNLVIRDTVSSKWLVKGTDYDFVCTNNVDPGTATVTITGLGNYVGSTRICQFDIVTIPFRTENITISEIPDVTYDGTQKTPPVTVQITGSTGKKTLIEGEDYEITYGTNKYPGINSGSFTITGKNAYSSSLTYNFNIYADISDSNLFAIKGLVSNKTYDVELAAYKNTLYMGYEWPAEDNAKADADKATTKMISVDNLVIKTDGNYPHVGYIMITGKEGSCVKGARVIQDVKFTGNLANCTFDGLLSTYDYTGAQITPKPTVYYGTQALTENVDFAFEYSANKETSSTGTVKIVPAINDCFSDQKSANFSIVYNLNSASVTGLNSQYGYTGAAITPTANLVVTCEDKTLVKDTDYKLQWADNINAGTATLTIVPKEGAKVIGSKTLTFEITGISIAGGEIQFKDPTTGTWGGLTTEYTGSAIVPEVKVIMPDGITELASGNYQLSWSNNRNVGTNAHVEAIASGNYVGRVSGDFEIKPKNIGAADVDINIGTTVGYAGGNKVMPQLVIKHNGVELERGTADIPCDYWVETTNNTSVSAAADAQAIIHGKGNYTGVTSKTFQVIQTDLTGGNMILSDNRSAYTGNPITPDVTVTYKFSDDEEPYVLKKDIDYTVDYGSATTVTEVGQYAIKITGKDNFYGVLQDFYYVDQRDIADADAVKITVADMPHTGLEVKPAVSLFDKNCLKNLVEGVDYEILSYENNIDSASKADPDETLRPVVHIRGLGNYKGTVDAYFNIGKALGDSEDAENPGPTTVALSQAAIAGYVYDGKEHPADFTVYQEEGGESKQLYKNVDYKYYFEDEAGNTGKDADLINAGIKTLVIKGVGNYYGTIRKQYLVKKKPVNLSEISFTLNCDKDEDGNYITYYNGSAKQPLVTVYDTAIDSRVPVSTDCFDVEYTNNVNVSSAENPAYAKVRLTKNYDYGADGELIPFYILARDVSDDFTVVFDGGISKYEYTGLPIHPSFTVKYSGGGAEAFELTPETDYTVEWADDVLPGEASLTITGRNNYGGTKTVHYDIYGDLSKEYTEVTIENQLYTGEYIKPVTKVTCAGVELEQGVDYDVESYAVGGDWKTADTGRAIIKPLSKYYSGFAEAYFAIEVDMDLVRVENYEDSYVYTGKPIKPAFKLIAENDTQNRLVSYNPDDVVYTTTKSDSTVVTGCTDVGQVVAKIPIVAQGETYYKEVTFAITPRSLTDADVNVELYFEQESNRYYTGQEIKPDAVKVSIGDKQFEENVDFAVEYKNNVHPGTADVKISPAAGNENFTGTINKVFVVKVWALDDGDLVATSTNSTSITLTWTKNMYVTGYQVSQIVDGKMVNLCFTTAQPNANGKLTYTKTGLKPNAHYTFVVRPYVYTKETKIISYGQMSKVSQWTSFTSGVDYKVTSTVAGTANIKWVTDDDMLGYEIYRSDSKNGTFSRIAIVPKSSLSYTDRNVVSGNKYYYKIVGYTLENGQRVTAGVPNDSVEITIK